MKRLLSILLVVIMVGFVAGCAQNSTGTYGPAWDVPIKVPMAQNKTKTAQELLEGEEGVSLPEGGVVSYQTTETLDAVNVGQILTDVTLPTISETVNLPLITLSNVIDDTTTISIPAGVSGDGTASNSISISALDSIKFSSNNTNNINQMDITITAPTNFKINSLTLTLIDNATSGELGSINFGEIPAGNDDTKSIDLSNDEINGQINVEVSNIDTGGTLGNFDDMGLAYNIPQAEISKITGYSDGFNTSTTKSITLSNSDLTNNPLQSITFGAGSLTANVDSGTLTCNVNSIQIDGQDASDLNNTTVNINNGEVNVDVDFDVSGTDYDTNDQINVSGGFSAGTEIYSVTTTVNERTESFTSQTLIDNLPDEINDLKLNNPTVKLIVENNTDLTADLSNIAFTANYTDGTTDSTDLGIITGGNAQVSNGTNEISLLNDLLNDPDKDLLDLIYTEPQSINVGGGYSIGDGSEVKITKNDTFDLSVNIETPFDVTLEKDIVEKMTPEAVEGLDQDDIDRIKDGTESGRIITNVDNQFPIAITVKFYLASVSNGATMTDNELKTAVYQEENLLKEISIDKEVLQQKELMISDTDLDKFAQDSLYTGVEFIIPQGDMVLESGDEVNVQEAYSVLTTKVNQN